MKKAKLMNPGVYASPPDGTSASIPNRMRRIVSLIALQTDPKIREAFLAWAYAQRESKPVAKANLFARFERLFRSLDSTQMRTIASVVGLVEGI